MNQPLPLLPFVFCLLPFAFIEEWLLPSVVAVRGAIVRYFGFIEAGPLGVSTCVNVTVTARRLVESAPLPSVCPSSPPLSSDYPYGRRWHLSFSLRTLSRSARSAYLLPTCSSSCR